MDNQGFVSIQDKGKKCFSSPKLQDRLFGSPSLTLTFQSLAVSLRTARFNI